MERSDRMNLKTGIESLRAEDRRWPRRHQEIHRECCERCPSNNNKLAGIIDPESADLKREYSKEFIAKNSLFVCAWRPNKLCKGNCDFHEIDEKFIQDLGRIKAPEK